MNRGLSRQPVFLNKTDYLNFLAILLEVWSRWHVEVYAYCLMGNHYHLCLKTPEAKLSRVMRHINGLYTQRFNRLHRRDGPLFRGRYKAMLIEEERYLGQVIRYIHLNPVEAGFVKRPQDYPWSSHKAYLSQKAPPWLSWGLIGEWFGSRTSFHNFVLEGNEKTIGKLYSRKRWPVILGSEEFIEQAGSRVSKRSREHTLEENRFVRPSVQRILEAVAKELCVPLRHLMESSRGKENKERKMALWALKEFGDLTHTEIAETLGLRSPRTSGWISHQAKQEFQKNRSLRMKLKKVERQFGQQKT